MLTASTPSFGLSSLAPMGLAASTHAASMLAALETSPPRRHLPCMVVLRLKPDDLRVMAQSARDPGADHGVMGIASRERGKVAEMSAQLLAHRRGHRGIEI